MSYGQDPWQPTGPSQNGDSRGYHDPYGRWREPYQGQAGPSSGPRPSDPPAWSLGDAADDEPELIPRSRSGGRSGGGSTGPGRSRRARAEEAAVAPQSGSSRINDDLDLDEVDPKGSAQRRAAKQAAREAERKPARR